MAFESVVYIFGFEGKHLLHHQPNKMEDAPPPPAEGGEGRGRGGFGRGGRGRGRGRGGRGGRGRREEGEVWTPVTKLGRLVKEGKIGSIEEIFLFSLPVKEAEIIDFFLKDKLEKIYISFLFLK